MVEPGCSKCGRPPRHEYRSGKVVAVPCCNVHSRLNDRAKRSTLEELRERDAKLRTEERERLEAFLDANAEEFYENWQAYIESAS